MYNAVIIGGGPAGYTCAIRIAQLGGKVVIVERAQLGGDCTNYGCIPTKALHASAGVVDYVRHAQRYGLNVDNFSVDYSSIVQRKNRVVKTSVLGIKKLLESYGVEIKQATAHILTKNKVQADHEVLETKNIVIATGAQARLLPGVTITGNIVTSHELLDMQTLPKSMVIIGGGYIGCEFASIFATFGVEITILEATEGLLPNVDREIANSLRTIMERNGITITTKAFVQSIKGNEVVYSVDGTAKKIQAEKILIAIGLTPTFDKECLDKMGVMYDKGILVNDHMQTKVKNIYAVGDVTGKIMLAHVAAAQAEVAAENCRGKKSVIDYSTIPACIFTFPEIAMVGEINLDGVKGIRVGKFPFAASGKARCMEEIEGFVKVYIKDNKLVGCHIIGAQADSLISEAAVALKNKIPVQKLMHTIHPHPTLSEAFYSALYDAYGEAIDLPKK